MSHRQSRRNFLKQSAALAAAGFWVGGVGRADDGKSPNERVHIACIGVGGKGESDTADAARFGNVVALCDVDEERLGKAGAKYPKARRFADFRKMLDAMGKSIDAVTVSTPDHTHAAASALAMRMGKHCFTQKPLTHTLYEARKLAEIARQMKVATQMGNQGTASTGLRRTAAQVRAGALGTIKEVHVWTDRPIWPQGVGRPAKAEAPPSLHWDLWLGPVRERPYGAGYHPFAWRGFWDFGTGALGDMGCHNVNLPFLALDLRDPVAVEAETPGHNRESYPKWSVVRYTFPERNGQPGLTMVWYDGGKLPPAELVDGDPLEKNGVIFVGTKGRLLAGRGRGAGNKVYGEMADVKAVFTESPGHFQEFVRAIKGGPTPASNFPDYAGLLTETVLLGNLAVWAGKRIEWDARNLRAANAPEVAEVIRTEYRTGFAL